MRTATISRQTAETKVELGLTLDGRGAASIDTGIGFLDHMLQLFAAHGLFDVELTAQGDLQVDVHHTIEDVAIVLGQAVDQALGDRRGIRRVGHVYVPMDETLARVVIDLSGRPYAVFRATWSTPYVGQIPTTLFRHFFESFAFNGRLNLHAAILEGDDDHHRAEALFKALGRALDVATERDPRRGDDIPSTKGVLS